MIILQAMFSRGLGGLERAFLDHALLLSACGHVVHCLIAERARSRQELERLASQRPGLICVHPVETQGWRRLLLRLSLNRLIRRLQPAVIVGHGAVSVSRLARARPREVPLVAVTHNASPRLMKATHLIALTGEMERLFVSRGFPAQRILRVPNVLPQRFADLPPQTDRPLHDPPTIGVLARLIPKKGVDVFLRGLRLALDRGMKARAVIGGDGDSREALQALCGELRLEDAVEFAGWVTDPQAFYRRIDLLCVPSRDEPFGIVLLEAFAQGTPVVASDVGGPRELIHDGIDGLLFESGNPADLAAKLAAVLASPQTLQSMRLAAYAQLPQYRSEAVAARLETALKTAIADFGAPLAPALVQQKKPR